MRILFITDRNLTHDIRLFNEIHFASAQGYKAELIAFSEPWSQEIEKVHLELAKPLKAYYIDPKKHNLTKIQYHLAKLLHPILKTNLWANAFSLNARTALIWNKLQSLEKKYDLIIAHGFSSLFAAYAYAQKNNTRFAFDAASFIPELDTSDYDTIKFHKQKLLFKKIIPFAEYFTYSTDLVGNKLKKLFVNEQLPPNFQIANSYLEEFFTFRPSISDRVEFVWIGQKIDICPDIDIILPTLKKFRDKIRLHIFGQTTDRFRELHKNYEDFIVIHRPLPLDLMLKTVAMYDIGLAVYLTYVSPEKNYTVSNKIYAFIQNGLYTIASDTISQRIFFNENPLFGKIVLPNIDSLTVSIGEIIDNIYDIRESKQQRYKEAKKFSWKYESQKLIDIWKKIQKDA